MNCPYTISGCNYPQGECLGVCCADSRGHSATTETQARAVEPVVPKWWNCDTHGRGTHSAWGCPECVREMRDAIAKKDAALKAQNEALKVAVRQNGHDMLMTGEELRQCEASITQAKEALK